MTQNYDYDVVIVGAGPAGATFARLLHPHYRVLLLDKQAMSTQRIGKPCGGLLAPDAQKVLAQFDLTLPKEILVNPQIFAVKTIDLKTGMIRHYQRSYLNLDRKLFDRWLVSLVPEQVTVLKAECRSIQRKNDGFDVTFAEEETGEQTVHTRFLVGADGANSIVRRTFFPNRKLRHYVAIQQWFVEKEHNPFYSCIFDPETSDCCSWSISKDDYFIFGGAFPPRNCRENFEKQKDKLKNYSGFHFSNPVKTEACLVLRPSSPRSFCCGEQNVFLLGEAAGFISPSSLEGISWAINSGVLLSKIFNHAKPGQNLNWIYRKQTRPMRMKLFGKVLKCPFMYQPFLRKLVMKSKLSAIDLLEE
jgi:flavin-dependent dehydrogenase